MKAPQRKLAREKLQRIVEMCQSVEERSLDPFLLDISELIGVIKEYFPEWELPEDLCLDAETIQHLASIVGLQSDWIKQRSTSLYTDPFLLEERLKRTSKKCIAKIFLKVWHPTVELEQISIRSLEEAIKYWQSLAPLNERWKEYSKAENETGIATREELVQLQIMRDRAFSEELEQKWNELKEKTRKKGEDAKIPYWRFICAETYEETVYNAFMVSFLVTYGYATLEIHPLEEEIFIKPYDEPLEKIDEKQSVSIPIAVTVEDWRRSLKE